MNVLILTQAEVDTLLTMEACISVMAEAITAIRTAAISGLATRLLARPDANDLAIIGSGIQVRSHLAAIHCVRSLKRVRIAS